MSVGVSEWSWGADLPPPFSSGRGGPRWRVAPVVSCLAPGNSSISLVDLFRLK